MARADDFRLPAPGAMVHVSPEYNPAILKGIKVHPENPFRFDFILDQGDVLKGTVPSTLFNKGLPPLKQEATKLIKYFLASLTVPEKDLWVNLSPYEKNRIIPNSFGLTAMGRDLLAEDYMLKQITASLIYPEGAIGRRFWKRIYEEADQKYGTTNVAVNTFNKVWIVPEKAVVYENAKAGTAYVVEAKLKVMLEEDYLALEKNLTLTRRHVPFFWDVSRSPLRATVSVRYEDPSETALNVKATQGNHGSTNKDISTLGSQILREIVIPQLTKEVNEGKNFAQLRQVYNSLVLATWYKKKIKESILAQVYEDKNRVTGLSSPNVSVGSSYRTLADARDPKYIYQQYLKAFKKGVYNFIKEDQDPITQQPIPRKYFSGGLELNPSRSTIFTMDNAMVAGQHLDDAQVVYVDMAMASGPRADQAMTARGTLVDTAAADQRAQNRAMTTEEEGRLKAAIESTHFENVNNEGNHMDVYSIDTGPLKGYVIKVPFNKRTWLHLDDKEREEHIKRFDHRASFVKEDMGGVMAPFVILENVFVNGKKFPRVVVMKRLKVFSKMTDQGIYWEHFKKYYDDESINRGWKKKFNEQIEELIKLMIRRSILYGDAIAPLNFGIDENAGQLYFIDFGNPRAESRKESSVASSYIFTLSFVGVHLQGLDEMYSLWGVDSRKKFPVPDVEFPDQNIAVNVVKGAMREEAAGDRAMAGQLLFNFFIARHGQTFGNVSANGADELNYLGRIQAQLLAHNLINNEEIKEARRKGENIVVVTSRLKRSKQTAQLFIDALRGQVEVWQTKDADERYEGESEEALKIRQNRLLEKLNLLFAGRTVVLFGHGLSTGPMRKSLGDKKLSNISDYAGFINNMLHNGEYVFFKKDDNRATRKSVNQAMTVQVKDQAMKSNFQLVIISDEYGRYGELLMGYPVITYTSLEDLNGGNSATLLLEGRNPDELREDFMRRHPQLARYNIHIIPDGHNWLLIYGNKLSDEQKDRHRVISSKTASGQLVKVMPEAIGYFLKITLGGISRAWTPTLESILRIIEKQSPEFYREVVENKIAVAVNGQHIINISKRLLLNKGDEVSFIPPVITLSDPPQRRTPTSMLVITKGQEQDPVAVAAFFNGPPAYPDLSQDQRTLIDSIHGRAEEREILAKYLLKDISLDVAVEELIKLGYSQDLAKGFVDKVDRAMINVKNGGIDLTTPNMNVQTQNSNGEIKFYIDPAMLQQLKNAPGFVPVIVGIEPLKNLQEFLVTKQ